MPYTTERVSKSHDRWYTRKKGKKDKAVTEKQYREILRNVKLHPANKKLKQRDYMLLLILGNLGLRVSEAVILKREHFEGLEDYIPTAQIPTSKKRKNPGEEFEIYVHPDISKRILKYMDKEMTEKQQYLFEGMTDDGHLGRKQPDVIFKTYLKQCKIKEKYTLHSLRHMFASRIYKKTNNIIFVRDQLRHESAGPALGPTEVYTQIEPEDAYKMIKKIGRVL